MIATYRISPFSVIVIFTGLAIIGLWSIPGLTVRPFPTENVDIIRISIANPGLPLRRFEQEIVSKTEGYLLSEEYTGNIESFTERSKAVINLQLKRRYSKSRALFKVRQLLRNRLAMNFKGSVLPQAELVKAATVDVKPLLTLAIVSLNSSLSDPVYEKIRSKILDIKGVDKAVLAGKFEEKTVLIIDRDKCQAVGITTSDLRSRLEDRAQYLFPSCFGDLRLSLYKNSEKDIRKLPILKKSGTPLFLGDLIKASIEVTGPSGSKFRHNHRPALRLDVYGSQDINSLSTAARIKCCIEKLQETYANRVGIITVIDGTISIVKEIRRQLMRTGFTILIFIFLLMIFYQDRILVGIIAAALIATVTISFAIMQLLNIEFHFFSLAGIVVSFSLVLDNSLMVADHLRTCRHNMIIRPMMASSLTTIAAVSMIYFLPGKWSVIGSELASIIIVNLAVSFGVSLFFVPSLFLKFYPEIDSVATNDYSRRREFLSPIFRFSSSNKKLVLIIGILFIGIPVYRLPQKLDENFCISGPYNKIFGSDLYQQKISPITDKIFGGVLRVFDKHIEKRQSIKEKEDNTLRINLSSLTGPPSDLIEPKVIRLERLVSSLPGVNQIFSEIGQNHAVTFIQFESRNEAVKAMHLLENELWRSGEIRWSLTGMGSRSTNKGAESLSIDYLLEFKGYDFDSLLVFSESFLEMLESNPRITGIVDLTPGNRNQVPSLYAGIIHLDSTYEWPSMDMFSGKLKIANGYRNREIELILDGWPENAPIEGETGKQLVSVNSLGTDRTISKRSFYKRGNEYLKRFGFSYIGDVKTGERYIYSKVNLRKKALPMGFFISLEKTGENSELPSGMFILLLVLIYLIYTITAVLLNSVRSPFIIVLLIPLSAGGVILSMYALDIPFDEGALTAVLLTSGLVVNSAIYIANAYKVNLSSKPTISYMKAFHNAFSDKFKPLGLTLIATALGFSPFIVVRPVDSFWYSLAAGTMGGLMISIPMLIFVLPLLIKEDSRS